MDPDDVDDLEERLRRLKKRAALHKHILARRAEKVDNTVHLQILNARFAKEVRAMLAEGLTMDQVGQELGMSSEEIFAATLNVAKRASGSFSWNKHNLRSFSACLRVC